MNIYYNPVDKACKSLIGAFARGKNITLAIYSEGGEENFSAESCMLVLHRDGCAEEEFPMRRNGNRFAITLCFHEIGLYFYHFRMGPLRIGRGNLRRGEIGAEGEWQITVFEENYHTPDWFKGGVMYQIFPDRFAKSGECSPLKENKIMRRWGEQPCFRPNEYGQVLNNDFFGGNLNGIREKLGYLKRLGVTVIYLNPIFEAFSNHRYDTGDYFKIDNLLGTVGDFEALVKEAGEKGIKIILDGVFNHTGADSRYFNLYGRYPTVGAYQSTDSPYADWFCFHPFPDQYDCWWGIKTLPAVNEHSENYREFILGENGVLKTWLRRGIGGWRLDVADELPDFFLKELRASVKEEAPDALILGEVWEDASNKIAYDVRREYFQGAELDSVMNYPLKNAIIGFLTTGNCEQLRNTIFMLLDHYPPESLHCLMNILGTHDTARILTVLGGKQCATKEQMAATRLSFEERLRAQELLKMAAVLQFTLPGVPCIYYGDENGMEGYADPFCRACYDWDNPDTELNQFYEKLGALRSGDLAEAFRMGDYEEIFADYSCIVYARKSGTRNAYIYVNRSDREYLVHCKGVYREYFSGEQYREKFYLKPNSFGILSKL